MQQALRPYVTAGVALVGASLIAATLVKAPSPGVPHVHLPAIQLTSDEASALPAAIAGFEQTLADYNNYWNNFLVADPNAYSAFYTLINNEAFPGTISECLSGGCIVNLSDPAVRNALQELLGYYQFEEANYQTVPYYDPSIDAQLHASINDLQSYLISAGIGTTNVPPPPDVPPNDFGLPTDVNHLAEWLFGGNPGGATNDLGDSLRAAVQSFEDGFGMQTALSSDPISNIDRALAPLGLVQTGGEMIAHENGALSGNSVDQLHELLEGGQFVFTAAGGLGTEAITADPELALNPWVDVGVVGSVILAPAFGFTDNLLTAAVPG